MTVQVTINSLSEIQQEAEIHLSSEELQAHFEEAYQKQRPKIELKGFRKGKVPMEMIKRLYGEAIEHEALDSIADTYYHRAMQERNIQPVGQPAMVDMKYQRGEHFRFRIKYDVKPTITLKTYKGLRVEKPVHIVTDADVDAEINHLQRVNSTTSPATAVSGEQYIVTGDVQELDDAGTPLIGKKTSGTRFYLADETLTTEIKEALKTAEVGQTYRVRFESKHGDHPHPIHVAITVTSVENVVLPSFDEDLVRKITGSKVSSPEEFRRNLRGDLERYWSDQANAQVENALASEVVRQHEFPIPDSLVEAFLDTFVNDIKNRTRERTLPKGFDEKKFRADSRADAVWQAKWMLLKERIANAEHLTVSDEDLQTLAETDATQMGIQKDRLLQYYKSSSAAQDRVLSRKVMVFLKDHARITQTVAGHRA